MARHFFVCSALPDISIEQKPRIDFESFIHMVKFSCTHREWQAVCSVRSFFDLMNLQAVLYERPLQLYGNVSPREFQDPIRHSLELPPFIVDFLTHYSSRSEQKEHFPALVAQFFYEKRELSGFVGEFFSWLEEFFIVGGLVRSKRLGRDIAKELEDEDFSHPLVIEGLAYRNAANYDPPYRFAAVKEIYERDFTDPKALEKNTSNFIFQHLEAIKEDRAWTLDFLLAYMVQLILVEHLWPKEPEHFDLEALIAS